MNAKCRARFLMVAGVVVVLGLVTISRVAAVEKRLPARTDEMQHELILESIHVVDVEAEVVAKTLRDLMVDGEISYDPQLNEVLLLMDSDRLATAKGIVDELGREGGPQRPFELSITGIVVRLASNSEFRKPFLRVDSTCYFPPEIGADELMVARLRGPEGKDAVIRGVGKLPPVEEIEVDHNFFQDTLEEAIKEAVRNSGLQTPSKVRFSSFVLQG